MTLSLDSQVALDPDVVFRELEGEAVILHLGTGLYYGLDAVGTRMWQLLAAHGHVRRAFERLSEEFEVRPDTLRADLLRLVGELRDKGLIRVTPGES